MPLAGRPRRCESDGRARHRDRDRVRASESAAGHARTSRPRLCEHIELLAKATLRETLKVIEGPVDFVLMDVWAEMVVPAIELISPHLRPGALVVYDNTEQFAKVYVDYFAFVRDPANRLGTLTLPYSGGLELTVRI